jgi:dihydropteroate synthase
MTKIVGILNVTPDSFSDGGRYINVDQALRRADVMFQEGARLIDIGGESTRPGAIETTINEEWARLEPLLARLQWYYFASSFSIDTRHGEIAERAVEAWSKELTINDVSGLSEQRMVEIVAANSLKIIVSHLPEHARGNIAAAHQRAKMTSVAEVRSQLAAVCANAVTSGVKPENIILDPGIGFGKSPQLNHKLIGFAALVPNSPVMIGYSCKRFLGTQRMDPVVNVEAGRRAVRTGAAYIRVHEVAAHHEMLQDEQNR